MSRLTIAIPTFRRPQDLKRAVSGVLEQAGELVGGSSAEAREPEGDAAGAADTDGGAGRGVSDVEVLVIDNDAQGTGHEAALAAAAEAGVPVRSSAETPEGPGGVGLRYVIESLDEADLIRKKQREDAGEAREEAKSVQSEVGRLLDLRAAVQWLDRAARVMRRRGLDRYGAGLLAGELRTALSWKLAEGFSSLTR